MPLVELAKRLQPTHLRRLAHPDDGTSNQCYLDGLRQRNDVVDDLSCRNKRVAPVTIINNTFGCLDPHRRDSRFSCRANPSVPPSAEPRCSRTVVDTMIRHDSVRTTQMLEAQTSIVCFGQTPDWPDHRRCSGLSRPRLIFPLF